MAGYDEGLNWFYAAKGLECLKLGLEDYVCTQIEQKYNNLIQTVENTLGYSPIDCSMQSLIPFPIRFNFVPQTYSCDIHNTRDVNSCVAEKCANAVCYKLLIEIKKMHVHMKPIWANTDPSKWTGVSWEIAKCFLSSTGYTDTNSVKDVDCSGLLSILINMLPIASNLSAGVLPKLVRVWKFIHFD